MSSKHTPVITKSSFDEIASELTQSLGEWHEDEKNDLDADLPADLTSDPLFEDMPEIDSKSVVKASPIIRKLLGAELDPKLIRKGGYTSFDDLIADLLPKLRASCPDSLPLVLVEGVHSESVAANV